jgi:hypothetical protein
MNGSSKSSFLLHFLIIEEGILLMPHQEKIKKSIIFANKYRTAAKHRKEREESKNHLTDSYATPFDNHGSGRRERVQFPEVALLVTRCSSWRQ